MKPKFGPVQTIPDAVLNKLGQAAAIGRWGGVPEAYFFANGAQGTFYALDAATGEKRFSMQVAGQLAPKASVIALGRDGSVFYSLSGKDIYRIPRIPSSSAAVVSS